MNDFCIGADTKMVSRSYQAANELPNSNRFFSREHDSSQEMSCHYIMDYLVLATNGNYGERFVIKDITTKYRSLGSVVN